MSIVLTASNKSPQAGDFFAKKSSKKANNTFNLSDLFIYSATDDKIFRPATFTVVVGTQKVGHGIKVIPPHIQLNEAKTKSKKVASKSLQVKAINVSGFLGRPAKSINGNCLSITNDKVYAMTDGCIVDDSGRKLKLNPKPYAKSNGCDFYMQDHSASEGHSDFKIISS